MFVYSEIYFNCMLLLLFPVFTFSFTLISFSFLVLHCSNEIKFPYNKAWINELYKTTRSHRIFYDSLPETKYNEVISGYARKYYSKEFPERGNTSARIDSTVTIFHRESSKEAARTRDMNHVSAWEMKCRFRTNDERTPNEFNYLPHIKRAALGNNIKTLHYSLKLIPENGKRRARNS